MISFLFAAPFTWDGLGRYIIGVVLASTAFVSFLIIVHSLTFWLGNAAALASLLMNAILTFALLSLKGNLDKEVFASDCHRMFYDKHISMEGHSEGVSVQKKYQKYRGILLEIFGLHAIKTHCYNIYK